MALSSIEAVDLLRFADLFADKLAAATAELSRQRGHEREKAWMDAALAVIDEAREPAGRLVDRARGLPELSELRAEFGVALLNAWVDALEKLVAGITFHVSGRSPIIEALFPNQKFPVLRKSPREVVEKFQKDFEKRLKSGYVARMLATEDFAFAGPVLEQVAKAWSEYLASFSAEGLPPQEAAPIREELIAGAQKVELAIRQARLVAEAALLPMTGAFEAAGLTVKPKKRAKAAVPVEPLDVGAADELDAAEAEDADADDAASALEAEAGAVTDEEAAGGEDAAGGIGKHAADASAEDPVDASAEHASDASAEHASDASAGHASDASAEHASDASAEHAAATADDAATAADTDASAPPTPRAPKKRSRKQKAAPEPEAPSEPASPTER